MKVKPASNLVVISDLHCGCRLGLCPPEGIDLDDGGHYAPSALQLKVWKHWRHFWDHWVPTVTHGQPFDLALNGDWLDGNHHQSTTQISHNPADQAAIGRAVVEPVAARARRLFVVRGTEAHAGKSATDEERLARELGAVPNTAGQHARWELRIRVGTGIVHLLHHISTTGSAQHETSAINSELAAHYTDACRWGRQPPDVIARAHRHRCAEVRLPRTNAGRISYVTAFVTAGWQLKTPFAYKVAGARVTTPQLGGSIVRQGDEELHTRHYVADVEPPEIE